MDAQPCGLKVPSQRRSVPRTKNSLRLENSFMESLSSVSLRMLATRDYRTASGGLSAHPATVQRGLRIRFDVQEPHASAHIRLRVNDL